MFGSHFFEINFNYKVQISRTKRFRSLRSQEGVRFLNLDLTCLNIYFDVGIFNQTLFERNFDCIPRLEDLKIRSKFYKSYGTFKFKKKFDQSSVKSFSPFPRFFTIYNDMKRKRGAEKNMQKARGPTRGNLFHKFIRRPTFRCIPWNRINEARAEVSRQFESETGEGEREREMVRITANRLPAKFISDNSPV